MSNYDDFLRLEEEEARKKAQAYETKRRAQAQQQAQATTQSYDRQRDAYRRQAQTARQEVDATYAQAYDANAVDELAARRRITEAIANSNLLNSGLNNTQHTAVSLRRMRADSDTAAAKRTAVARIMQALDEREAQLTEQEAEDHRSLISDTEEAVLAYREQVEKQATQTAQSRYKAALEEEERNRAQSEPLPSGFGSIQADKTYTPSYVTMSTNAMMRQRRISDQSASDYLHNMFSAGHLSFTQWKQLHEKLSIVPFKNMSFGSIRAVMKFAAQNRGEKEARLFVEYLRGINALTDEQADGLMQDLYAME